MEEPRRAEAITGFATGGPVELAKASRDLRQPNKAVQTFGVRAFLVIAGLVFAFLTLGASPAHFWLDSGEIAAAGVELGVMHPPGVPGLVVALHLASLVPLGPIGWRLALLSSLFAALALALLVSMLRRRKLPWLICLVLLFWVANGLTLLRQARVVEIYTLNLLCVATVLWAFDPLASRSTGKPYRSKAKREVLGWVAGAVGVWGFGDLRLVLVVGIGLLVFFWAIGKFGDRRRAFPSNVMLGSGVPLYVRGILPVVFTSLIVLSIPAASWRGPMNDWGDPDSFGRLWDHIHARSIREAFADQMFPSHWEAWMYEIGRVVERMMQDMGSVGLALGLIALLISVLRFSSSLVSLQRFQFVLLVFFVVEFFYCVAINPMGGEDRQTGIHFPFLAVLAVGGLWSTLSTRTMGSASLGRGAVLVAGVLAWVGAMQNSWSDQRNTRSWGSHVFVRQTLSELPPRALFVSRSDDLSAGISAAQMIEGARPDLHFAVAQHLHKGPSDSRRRDAEEEEFWQMIQEAKDRGGGEADLVESAIQSWGQKGNRSVLEPRAALLVSSKVRPMVTSDRLMVAPKLGLPEAVSDHGANTLEGVPDWLPKWTNFLSAPQDRVRLARLLGDSVKIRLKNSGSDRNLRLEALLVAEWTLRFILQKVAPDHLATMVSLAAIWDRLGRSAEAIALTEAALQIDSGRYGALTNMALFLSRDPNTREQALIYATRAVRLRPEQKRGWRRLQEICQQLGEKQCPQPSN